VVQLVEYAPPKVVGWVVYRSDHTEDLVNVTCGLVLGVNGWVHGSVSCAALSLTRHQCSIHCESSSVAHGASKRK